MKHTTAHKIEHIAAHNPYPLPHQSNFIIHRRASSGHLLTSWWSLVFVQIYLPLSRISRLIEYLWGLIGNFELLKATDCCI